jgi:spore maturation protein CgeB
VLARSGEPPALADAIEPLLVSDSLRERIAEAGRRRFTEQYTTAAMRRRFFAALQAIVDRRSGHAPEDADGDDKLR